MLYVDCSSLNILDAKLVQIIDVSTSRCQHILMEKQERVQEKVRKC